jgi:hypothetical protein
MTNRLPFLAGCVLLLAAALAPADPVAPFDSGTLPERAELVDEIEGEWEVVSILMDGTDREAVVKRGGAGRSAAIKRRRPSWLTTPLLGMRTGWTARSPCRRST